MSNINDSVAAAKLKGYRSVICDIPIDDNPYDKDMIQYDAWLSGRIEAQLDLTDKKIKEIGKMSEILKHD